MRVEIIAVGTELLLGQIVDTNSTFLSEQLAEAGMDCQFQTRVGDNIDRIADVLRIALARADSVIVCGGLGPTQDDITREAIAKVMNVELICDDRALELVRSAFSRRGREMSPSNAQQADVPLGGSIIEQRIGTAPGLICPIGEQVIYALPGVPDELREMMTRAVIPDLARRAGTSAVIASRVLRTWGIGESVLSEIVAPRVEALENKGTGAPTIAFLASGIEGTKVRVTIKAPDPDAARQALDAEEHELRQLLGPAVFGIDDETMEHAVGTLLQERGWMLAVAESFTGGLIASRIVALPGASRWFQGGVVTYATSAKERILSVPPGPVITTEAAMAMASAVRDRFGADVGLATTGVAGPDPQEGHPPGTAFVGLALPASDPVGSALSLIGGRENRRRVREIGTISALDFLRRRLVEESHAQGR